MCHLRHGLKSEPAGMIFLVKRERNTTEFFLNKRIYLCKLTHEVLWKRSFLL